MNFFGRLILLTGILLISHAFASPNIIIQKTLHQPIDTNSDSKGFFTTHNEIKIALISSPNVIGKYSQSTYNVALATLLGKHQETYTLIHIDIPDESTESLTSALSRIRQEGFNAVIAPLTSAGAQRLALLEHKIDIFIPTAHKRDVPDAPNNFAFGAIDYIKQIEALIPYMANNISVFYDDSAVGTQLKKHTETLFLETDRTKKSVASYPVDTKGDNIISYLAKPSVFSKKSIILHIPVVKSSILTAHMTFTGVKERNILSTQINVDPTLLSLTQYNDRKNMILANSIVEHSPAIYEANAIMNNDIAFDWINYATSVGTDYLISKITNTHRDYSMRLIDAQVIYPVELLKAEMFGFEPITAN